MLVYLLFTENIKSSHKLQAFLVGSASLPLCLPSLLPEMFVITYCRDHVLLVSYVLVGMLSAIMFFKDISSLVIISHGVIKLL